VAEVLQWQPVPERGGHADPFFRSVTPNTGPFELHVVSSGAAALLKKTGPAILFTHSQAGGRGCKTAIKSPNARAIVAFEPGSSFVFAKGDAPAPIPSAFDTVIPAVVSPEEFKALMGAPQQRGKPVLVEAFVA